MVSDVRLYKPRKATTRNQGTEGPDGAAEGEGRAKMPEPIINQARSVHRERVSDRINSVRVT